MIITINNQIKATAVNKIIEMNLKNGQCIGLNKDSDLMICLENDVLYIVEFGEDIIKNPSQFLENGKGVYIITRSFTSH